MDPRKTVFHEAAKAIDDLEKLHAKRDVAARKASESFAKRWDAKRDAILNALSSEARKMVSEQLGEDVAAE